MMEDLIKLVGFCKIPIAIFITLIPYFKYRLDKYKIKKEAFDKAEKSIRDLEVKLSNFVSYINELKKKIESNSVNESDLNYEIVDHFFQDLRTICDGVEQGFTAKTGNISDILNIVLKYQCNKKDNLIIDAYNAFKIAHKKAGRSFNEPLRTNSYDVLFRVYKSGFPFHKRVMGFFYEKIFNINKN